MKLLLSILTIFCFATGFSEERKSLPHGNYVVISDEYSSILKPGECIVRGKIHNPNYVSDDQKLPAIAGAYIGTLDKTRFTYSNDKGEFNLVLKEGDTSIYMFAQGYDEVVIWNYKFRSQHVVNIDFYAYDNYNMMEVDKPVIYCYSEIELPVHIEFVPKGELTFTYPVYENGWDMLVNSHGITDSKTNKTYPYLFWEAETDDLNFRSEDGIIGATLIRTDTLVAYLENTLAQIGLNETEQTDFITFWAPRMLEKEFAVIQFLTDDMYEKNIAELHIEPQPESMLRLYMFYMPLNIDYAPFPIRGQQFESFERKGFTVVEWGGSEMPSIELNP